MIVRIEGVLADLGEGSAVIEIGGGLTYEVLLSAYTTGRLGSKIGQRVTLHTLHYFDSLNQGATLVPRLAGFETEQDKHFFELFTTCKGIGHRKALRALMLDTFQVAAAIADRDVSMLQRLPEIGKRTAETVIATLHGKVDAFMGPTPAGAVDRSDTQVPAVAGAGRQALELLVQLGENQSQAMQWIDRALRDKDRPQDTQQLIERVYQIKSGS